MKLIKLFLLFPILILLTACGSRISFIEKEPISNASLVYLYQLNDVSNDDDIANTYYTVYINDKRVDDKIRSQEYMFFYLKPNSTTISIKRAAFEEKSITLDLKQGNIYYLRVKDGLDNNEFEVIQVKSSIGLKEIQDTGLVGSVLINKDEVITETIDTENKNKNNLSKTDKIKEAYKMKVDGLITDEEYKELKAQILAK